MKWHLSLLTIRWRRPEQWGVLKTVNPPFTGSSHRRRRWRHLFTFKVLFPSASENQKQLSNFQPKHATNQELKYHNSPFPVHHGQIFFFFTLVTNPSLTINHPPNHVSEEALFLTESKFKRCQPNASRENYRYLPQQLVALLCSFNLCTFQIYWLSLSFFSL